MEQLKAYLKELADEAAREQFAQSCKTSLGHLRNIVYGKACSAELAALVERESGGKVRRWHLRPLDWFAVWPELIAAPDAPPVPEVSVKKRRAIAGEGEAA